MHLTPPEPDGHSHADRHPPRPSGTRKAAPGQLLLETVGRCVPLVDLDRADIAAVVIEDLCWSIATADWSARRPPVWRRHARAAWRADGEALQAKRDRIRLMVSETGLSP